MKTNFRNRSKTIHTHELLAGKYRVEGRIATGGMGKIYRALQGDMARTVAVKIIDMAQMSPDMKARFRREMETLMGLQVPNVIPIYDYDKFRGHDFYVMPLLNGGSLKQRIEQCAQDERPLPTPGEVNQRLHLLAQALHRVHQKTIIHRDIKPNNIMLDEHGQPFIIDFGIARESDPKIEITSSSVVIGTWRYMCLSQLNAEKPSYTYDLYALAVTFYEVLNGGYPFRSQEEGNYTNYIVDLKTPDVPLQKWRSDLPDSLKDVFRKAFSQEPADQYPDMLAFAADFAKATQSLPNDDTGFFTFSVPQPTIDIHDQPSTLHTLDKVADVTPMASESGLLAGTEAWVRLGLAAVFLLLACGLFLFLATRSGNDPIAQTASSPPAISANPTDSDVVPASTAPAQAVITQPTSTPLTINLVVQSPTSTLTSTPTITPTPTDCDVLLQNGLSDLSQWRASGCIQVRVDVQLGPMVLVPCLTADPNCTPMWINQYEITRGQAGQSGDPELPWTSGVTGSRANNWCVDRGGRLLTEAEWRRASGADRGLIYPWGMEAGTEYPSEYPYPPSSYLLDISWAGVVGMGGNVQEWVQGSRLMGSSYLMSDPYRIDREPRSSSSSGTAFGFRCAQEWLPTGNS